MEGLLVSAATGALKPVLEKLAALIGDEFRRIKGVRREVQFLTDELAAMHAFLVRMSEEESPDAQDKAWMKEVREMSYDVEDSLDEFMLCVDGESASPDGFISKIRSFLTKAKTRRQVAKAIQDIKEKIKEVGDRNQRYRNHETITKTSNQTVDPRALVIFEDASRLVGIDRPKLEVIELLKENTPCVSTHELKVVSIVGYGGIGKTTLANQVYQQLKGEFQCQAFVSVSRNPDIMKVLRNILCQLSNEPHHNIEVWDMQLLISKIYDLLKDKRYLIVVDDIWEEHAWKTMEYAFPKNTKDSRIVTTTRKHDIAQLCCASDGVGVYEMKCLSTKDSKRLFLNRIFGSEERCPADLKGVSDNILGKCEGLPLAIISISGLLASKLPIKYEWDIVHNSIGRELAKDPCVESMMHILSLSFIDLPLHLKTCLLYLSIFPEDYTIDKEDLVRRWIAEGFLHNEGGQTLYELGERCFHELINRSLIQPWNIDECHEVRACRVHDIILDFIVSTSAEENFSTVISDDSDQKLASHDKIRRLSLHDCSQDNVSLLTKADLSHVRSLAVYNTCPHLPSLLKSRFLRAVQFEGCGKLEGHHLTGVGNLFQLKYLSLRELEISELPEQIGKLQYLETLIVLKTGVKELPGTIIKLARLVYLVVDGDVRLPDGIAGMKALEVLKGINIFRQSVNLIRDLGNLKHLRSLGLFFSQSSYMQEAMKCQYNGYMNSIVSSLCELGTHHLRAVSIDTDDLYEEPGFPLELWHSAPSKLKKLVLGELFISRVPNWTSSLSHMQELILYVKEFKQDDLRALGGLPCLVFLRLLVQISFKGRIIISGDDGFRCLKSFEFGCAVLLNFEVGAMPNLQKLFVMFNLADTMSSTTGGRFAIGIQHLRSLANVEFTIHGTEGKDEAYEAYYDEEVITRAVGAYQRFQMKGFNRAFRWRLYDDDIERSKDNFIHHFDELRRDERSRQKIRKIHGRYPNLSRYVI